MKKLLTISMILNLLLILLLGYSSRDIIKEKIFPSPKEEYTTHYMERKSLFEKLITPKNGIIFLGDSITEGGEWAELLNNPLVMNRGISGDTTKGVLNRLDSIISMSPKTIFILVGVNDLSKGVSVADILNNYENIIQRLKAETAAEIYIQSVLPTTNSKNKDRIPLVNQKLKELSDHQKVNFIDLYPLFSVDGNMNKNYSYDGVHLNGNGYEMWAKEIKR